jgi:hypothetical protein
MFSVRLCKLPSESLLRECRAQGAYLDCYYLDIERHVSLSEFVVAFYTSGPFRVERTILKLALGKPSTDQEAGQLGRGEVDTFAIWKVEKRTSNQILLKELTGRTKSWLMVLCSESTSAPLLTRLFFGSAVIPKELAGSNSKGMGAAFHSLFWFHKLYSQVLLASALRKLISPGK